MSSKRWKKSESDAESKPQKEPQPKAQKEEDAYVPKPEALVRTMFDFFQKKVEQNLSSVDKAEEDPGPVPDLAELSDSSDDEEDFESDNEIADGPYVRVVVNSEDVPQRLRIKKRWQRARKSRAVGNRNLNETVLSGTRPRGTNGGMKRRVLNWVFVLKKIMRFGFCF